MRGPDDVAVPHGRAPAAGLVFGDLRGQMVQ